MIDGPDNRGLSGIDWTVPPDPAEIEQLRELAKLPFSEKLKWLAKAQQIVEHLQHSREMQLRGTEFKT